MAGSVSSARLGSSIGNDSLAALLPFLACDLDVSRGDGRHFRAAGTGGRRDCPRFAAERTELLRNVESQRLATLEWATAERREAIADVRRELAGAIDALRGERAVVVDDLRHIVDVVLLRVAIFLVAAVVLAPLVAHAYALVWPRRWRKPPT
jgi:hypothetical protein